MSGNKGRYRRWVRSVLAVVVILALVSGTAWGASTWTRIDRLMVTGDAYVLGSLQVDGTMIVSGATDLNGEDLVIDADADTVLDETSDDNIRLTSGAATGLWNVLTGNFKVGNGVPTHSQDGEDAYIEGTLENDTLAFLDGNTYFGGGHGATGCTIWSDGKLKCNGAEQLDSTLAVSSTIDVHGNIFDNTGAVHIADPLGVTGTLKVTGNSDFEGTLYDNTGALHIADPLGITGTLKATGNAFLLTGLYVGGGHGDTGCTLYADGKLKCNGAAQLDSTAAITGSLAANGGITVDSTAFSVADSTGNVVTNGTLDVHGNLFDNTGAVHIADPLGITGTLKATSNAFLLTGLYVGGGHGNTGCTLFADGQMKCDGKLQLDSTMAITGAVTANGGMTVGGGDVTLNPESTVGDAGARNQFIGLPRIKLVGVGVKDGSGEVEVDDSPEGEWTATAHVTRSADTSHYKIGANSLKLAFAADAVATNGATCPTPNGDWTGMKSIGFWVYADKAFEAAQLVLYLADATDPATFSTCAYATPNVWQYCEVDITSLAGTVGDAVTDLDIRMAAGLPVAINIYIDNLVVWAAADEVSLGVALQQDGDLGFVNALTGAQLDPSADYTIAWRSGVDYIVIVSDLDPDGVFGMVAY